MKMHAVNAALVLAIAAPVWAQSPVEVTADAVAKAAPAEIDNAVIKNLATEFRDWLSATDQSVIMEQIQPKAKSLMEGLDVNALSAGQIETLLPIIITAVDPVVAAVARLETLVNGETLDGLLATTTATTMRAYSQKQRPDADTIKTILNHPKTAEAVEQGRVLTLFTALGMADPSALNGLTDKLVGLSDHISGANLDAEGAMSLGSYWQVVSGVLAEDAEKLGTVRGRVSDAMRGTAAREKNPDFASSLKDQIASIDGAFARGELLDHEAPDIEFLWTSDSDGPGKLSDLRGKVVVVDFWATWCSPCVASFPNIAELVKHYEGYEVAVLGVTTPQGRHHGADGTKTITGNNQDQEFDLMAGYVKQKKITWPITFSERAVWTEYGVQGIPHVVIIDPKGIVRHRGLHPMSPIEEETVLIDALLKEAGLERPEG